MVMFRIANPQECQKLNLKHLDWDIVNECLITDDANLLSDECVASNCILSIINGKLQVLMKEENTFDTTAEPEVEVPTEEPSSSDSDIFNKLKEEIDKSVKNLLPEVKNYLDSLIDKNKLITVENFNLFVKQLEDKLNAKFDEIKESIQKERK